MAQSLCGVPRLINDVSTHSRTGSKITEYQRSKQDTLASNTTPMEHYDGFIQRLISIFNHLQTK